MSQTSVEAPVSEEPSIRETEDPPIAATAELPVVHVCSNDCRRCPVKREVDSGPIPLANHGAQRRQSEFNAAAFGYARPGDRFTRHLHEKESSLKALKLNVQGCTQIMNGTRVRIESMLYHAQCALEQEVAAERALYLRSDGREVAAPRTNEEIHALLYDKPMTIQESEGLVERIRSLLGGAEKA